MSNLTMLPHRPSNFFRRRSPAIAVEVRVKGLGTSFGALAASVRAEGVFLSTFQELAVGTSVIAILSLPDGPLEVEGTIVERGDPAGPGLAVAFEDLDDAQRMRLSAASSLVPESRVA